MANGSTEKKTFRKVLVGSVNLLTANIKVQYNNHTIRCFDHSGDFLIANNSINNVHLQKIEFIFKQAPTLYSHKVQQIHLKQLHCSVLD